MCKRSNALSRAVLMLRGLDGSFDHRCPVRAATVRFSGPRVRVRPRRKAGLRSRKLSVAIARGKHLFPFRTEKLSLSAPMVLGPRGPGRVGRRRFEYEPPPGAALFVLRAG